MTETAASAGRILVVDDSALNRMLVGKVLTEEGLDMLLLDTHPGINEQVTSSAASSTGSSYSAAVRRSDVRRHISS